MDFVDGFATHYNHWIVIVLMMTGFYLVIARPNMVKQLVGLSLFQGSVFILYISFAYVIGGSAPIIVEGEESYANPLPHVLILTAIVVGISTTAVGLALVVRIHQAFGTIEENEIQDLDKDD